MGQMGFDAADLRRAGDAVPAGLDIVVIGLAEAGRYLSPGTRLVVPVGEPPPSFGESDVAGLSQCLGGRAPSVLYPA